LKKPFATWEMIVALGFGDLRSRPHRAAVEVHEVTIGRGVGKDDAATAPVAGGVRPGARRRIAHAQLLRQGHCALPAMRLAPAAVPSAPKGRSQKTIPAKMALRALSAAPASMICSLYENRKLFMHKNL
jgi:hypothetical protein